MLLLCRDLNRAAEALTCGTFTLHIRPRPPPTLKHFPQFLDHFHDFSIGTADLAPQTGPPHAVSAL